MVCELLTYRSQKSTLERGMNKILCLTLFALISISCKPTAKPSTKVSRAKAPAPQSAENKFTSSKDKSDLEVSDEMGERVLRVLRAHCDKKAPLAEDLSALQKVDAPLIGVLYDESGVRRRRSGYRQGNLAEKAKNISARLCKSASDQQGYIHALIVTYTGRFPNFGLKGPFDNHVFEPQVNGLVYEYKGKRYELDPLEQLERNMGSKNARTALAKRANIREAQMPNLNGLVVEMYRAAHFGERYKDKKAQRFFRGHKVLSHEDVTPELLAERIRLIGQWYKSNVKDGEVIYEYSVSRSKIENQKRTMIRSTMATWVLNRLAVHLNDPELKKLGDTVIQHYLEDYFQMSKSKEAGRLIPSTKAIPSGNVVEKRWTCASFIAGACNEREDKAKYAEEMKLLLEWAMNHQRDDGIIKTQFGASQYFMPGQLLLIVSYFYCDTKDPALKEYFDRSFDAYAPALSQMMHMGKEWHIPYAPAWFTQPAAQMYMVTKEDKYKDLVFEINDRVLLSYELNARYQVYPDYDGMLAPKPNSFGNNSVTAASLEALTDAAVVAKAAGDLERLKKYKFVIKRTVAFLMRLQYVPENTYYFRNREQVIGGFKKDMLNTASWMDNVWHLTSAFMKIYDNKLLED